MADVVVGRGLSIAAGLLLLGGPLMVGAIGLGVPPAAAWIPPLVLAGLAVWSGRVPPLPLDLVRRYPAAAVIWVALLAVAATFSIRTSLFAHYPDAPRFSVAPGDQFREEHLCMTAYAEAARLLGEGTANVYAPELYRPGGVPRRIGRFTVDHYHYPPPFLLVPVGLRALAPEFFDFRRVWFAVQVTAVVGLWLAIAWWVGGETGRRFALAGIALMALPVTWAAIQVGNVQTTVVAVSLAGAMGIASGWSGAGATLLMAATLGKIFPGLLLAHVVVWHRPRVVAYVAASGTAIVLATMALFGIGVFRDFALGELPRMLSGEAFLQSELPWMAPVNQSIYGFTVKLRTLGFAALDRETGKMVTRALVALIGFAALAVAWRVVRKSRSHDDTRLAILAIAFGFLNLGSFISPFVGGAYGALGTIWLGTLLSIGTLAPRARGGFVAATAMLVIANALVSSPRPGMVPTTMTMIVSTIGGAMLLAINVGAIWAGAHALRGQSRHREYGKSTARGEPPIVPSMRAATPSAVRR